MRLLYLSTDPGIPVLGHKGGSVHVREMAAAMARQGVNVTIVSPRIADEGGRLTADVELREIPPVIPRADSVASELRARLAAQRAAVLELARTVRPHAIYERFALFSDAGVRAADELGIPHVLEVNAPLRREAARWRVLPEPGLAEELERRVFRATGRIVCVSAELARLVRASAEAVKVDVIANAIARERFRGVPARPPDAFTVGFAGSLKPWHGLETLVAAFRLAIDAHPVIRLEVVGDGPMRPLLAEAGIPSARMALLGAVDHTQLVRRMVGWHVGVAPYAAQTDFYFSPLKVLEYMAAGACPVASDLGQIRALLGGGSRGVLIPPDDPDALARALLQLACDPVRVAGLAAQARRHVLAHHTWDHNAEAVLAPLRASGRRAA
jgi:glycosyltransferase involved in cell wall biosynthesis